MKNQHLTECQLSGKALSGLAYFACWPAFLRKLAVQTDWAKHSERGGSEEVEGREEAGDILGLLAQLSSIGPHCFGGQVAEQLG